MDLFSGGTRQRKLPSCAAKPLISAKVVNTWVRLGPNLVRHDTAARTATSASILAERLYHWRQSIAGRYSFELGNRRKTGTARVAANYAGVVQPPGGAAVMVSVYLETDAIPAEERDQIIASVGRRVADMLQVGL